MFKKALSVVLSLSVLAGSGIAVAASAQDSETATGFAIASDIHYVRPMKKVGMTFADEGYKTTFNSESELVTNQSGFVLDEFLNQCAENDDCQFVLMSGDIATHGRDFAEDHEVVASKLRAFEKKTGKQVYVINGNHDNEKGSATDHKRFTEVYYEFGYDKALSTDEGTCSYSVELNDEYNLVAVDSCDENYRIVPKNDASRMDWVVKQIKAAKKQGKKVIMMMHHNLIDHDPYQKILQKSYVVDTPYSYAGLLADLGVKLVFTGHTHCNDVNYYTSPLGNTIYDFSSSSLGNFPAEYKFVNMTDSKITYETKKINHIDADKLASVCEGYSDAELEMMKNDFQAYILNATFSEEKEYIKGKINPSLFKIEESSPLYAKVKPITDMMNDMAETPLYGEGGIQQQAATYGLEIPDSNYPTLLDALTKAYLRYKTGEKIYSEDSTDLAVLIKTIAFTARKSVAATADSDMLATANELLQKIGYKGGIADNTLKAFCEKYGFATPAEKEAFSLVFSLFGGFISDKDGVDNRNGSIPGYSVKENYTNPFVDLIKKAIVKAVELLNKIISYLSI